MSYVHKQVHYCVDEVYYTQTYSEFHKTDRRSTFGIHFGTNKSNTTKILRQNLITTELL